MPLRPLHIWEVDENGNPKLDRHGEKIPHRKQGQPKKYPSEFTDDEREDYDDQLRAEKLRAEWEARNVLDPIAKARATLGIKP